MACNARVTIWAGTPDATPANCTRGSGHTKDPDSPHRDGRWRYGWDQGASSGMFYGADEEAMA